MSQQTEVDVEYFSLKTPYIDQGITHNTLSQGEMLTMALKIYAEGGENRMHQHPDEEHSFIVLEGQATFHVGSETEVRTVRPYEGITLAKGVLYRFETSGKENLVMIRAGARIPGSSQGARYPDGVEKSFDLEPEVKRRERKERPGPGFGELV